jgi:hypothetical protein
VFTASAIEPAPIPALEVRSETQCPRAADVSEAVGRVLGAPAAGAPRDVAELREEGDALVITLRRASGEILGERRVPATLDCAVRARVAAVSIAALEAKLGGDAAPPLPAPPLVVAAPVAAPPPPPVAAVVERTAPPVAAPPPLSVELGASVLASFNGTDLAPGGQVEAALRRPTSATNLVLSALGVGPHRQEVSAGEARWWRLGGELRARHEEPLGRLVRAQLDLGLALTVVVVEGTGYSRNGGAWLWDPGATASVRFAWSSGGVRPWLGVQGVYWPRDHRVSVIGSSPARASLPAAELFLAVGATFGGRR